MKNIVATIYLISLVLEISLAIASIATHDVFTIMLTIIIGLINLISFVPFYAKLDPSDYGGNAGNDW